MVKAKVGWRLGAATATKQTSIFKKQRYSLLLECIVQGQGEQVTAQVKLERCTEVKFCFSLNFVLRVVGQCFSVYGTAIIRLLL